MEVQYNMNLPLTITPVLHHGDCRSLAQPSLESKQPDLTFHCMCCSEYFVNPFQLYQHMDLNHPELDDDATQTDDEEKMTNDDDGKDYSWVLEPVCELVDLAENTNGVNEPESSSDSDDDDNESSSSSSTSSTSTTNSTSATTNTDSNTRDENTTTDQNTAEETTQHTTMDEEPKAHAVIEAESMIANNGNFFSELKLKMASPQESTSIILLEPPVSEATAMIDDYTVTPIQRTGRGRRSSALVALQKTHGDQKCFQCAQCEASFPNAGDLSKHVRSHITNKPFQCSICEKTFTHIGSLNTHIRIHTGEKPYKCDMCSKAFTQSSSLMVHVRSHSVKKPFQCQRCDKGFVNSSSLAMHLKSHNENESFTCPECENEFKYESMLDEHMRMHTQELVYQCSICRSGFRSSSELVQHMKCHMGEKPFTCSLCDRSFTQSGSLNIHMRIHTGEKPFHCRICDKAFTQASSLSVHMKIHSGQKPYLCYICGKSYSQQAYLNKHIQAHVTTQTAQAEGLLASDVLSCMLCGMPQINVNTLAGHMRHQHADFFENVQSAMNEHSKSMAGIQERQSLLDQQRYYMQQLQLMMHSQQGPMVAVREIDEDHKQMETGEYEDTEGMDGEDDYTDDYAVEEEIHTGE